MAKESKFTHLTVKFQSPQKKPARAGSKKYKKENLLHAWQRKHKLRSSIRRFETFTEMSNTAWVVQRVK